MSAPPITTPLPTLRPCRLQGKAYYQELRRLHKQLGYALQRDAEGMVRDRQRGRWMALTLKEVATLALRYRLTLAATFAYFEDANKLPTGIYDALKARGMRPVSVLREVWAELGPEEQAAILAAEQEQGNAELRRH
jgi:hypothetical protein